MENLNAVQRLTRQQSGLEQGQYQPDYPLMLDRNRGPFKSVNTFTESIQRNLEFLLLTMPGEWPMDPDKGVGLMRYLFGPAEPISIGQMSKEVETKIKMQLEKYLKVVELISAKFILETEESDLNQLRLKIVYMINRSVVVEQILGAIDASPDSIGATSENRRNVKFLTKILNEYDAASERVRNELDIIDLVSDLREI